MYINNKLRDEVFKNNILHGFWDNNRTYEQFIHNLLGEFDEAMDELMNHAPTEVYSKDGKKPEGAPTELADIIIFILDYFGGCNPQIDVDEAFLEEPDKYYKNPEWYNLKRQKEPWKYFIEIRNNARDYIATSFYANMQHGNNEFVGNDGITHSTPKELHKVIKLVLEFCDIYGIDMEHELISKINYNNSRPKGYRKIGDDKLLVTDESTVMSELLESGHGMYHEIDAVLEERKKINEEIERKRNLKEQLEKEQEEIDNSKSL